MKIDSHQKHTGRCLCGAVKFEITGRLREVINCHCHQCRRSHGHYAAYTAAEKSRVEMIEASELRWYASSAIAQRGFCQKCGSSLFWRQKNKGYLCISAGSLDQPTDLITTKHIFVEDAGDYYQIIDHLEQFPKSMKST